MIPETKLAFAGVSTNETSSGVPNEVPNARGRLAEARPKVLKNLVAGPGLEPGTYGL